MWGAADVLSFYGIIIASLGAAVGVFISIAYSRKQYSDDKRRDVLPYFAINILRRKCVDPFLIGWYSDEVKPFSSDLKTKEDLTYREYLYNKGYFVFLSDHIEYKTSLSDGQEKAVQTGMEIKDYDGHAQVWQTNVFYIPIELQNVGNGCAINTKIDITAFKRNYTASSISISVPVGEKMYVGLYFDVSENISGRYNFRVRYYDIYNNLYVHHKIIEVNTGRKMCSINLSEDTSHYLVKEGAGNTDATID